MLFNSYIYILLFLPLTVGLFFIFNQSVSPKAGRLFLLFASLFFYAYWNPIYLLLILASMSVSFSVRDYLIRSFDGEPKRGIRKPILLLGVCYNVGILVYFKYADFLIDNTNFVLGTQINLLNIILPLGISFFTFQKIADMTDCYFGKIKDRDLINYCTFVTFFPQLIAGPIVHFKDIIPQLNDPHNKSFNWDNCAKGAFIFTLGLFKKVCIADSLAPMVSAGFDKAIELNFLEAWIASLAYTFQLYFDFSGYSEMALGSALFFNIHLVLNFNSPYKAKSIQEFWKRWHISLSVWLRDYIYIPLGGSYHSLAGTVSNLFITFLIGGFWHGAKWTFVLWGIIHGVGVVIHRIWTKAGVKIPAPVAWAMTFLYVHFAWVFFRANSMKDAFKVFRGMFGLSGFEVPGTLAILAKFLPFVQVSDYWVEQIGMLDSKILLLSYTALLAICVFAKNTPELARDVKYDLRLGILTGCLFMFAFSFLSRNSEFLYFQF